MFQQEPPHLDFVRPGNYQEVIPVFSSALQQQRSFTLRESTAQPRPNTQDSPRAAAQKEHPPRSSSSSSSPAQVMSSTFTTPGSFSADGQTEDLPGPDTASSCQRCLKDRSGPLGCTWTAVLVPALLPALPSGRESLASPALSHREGRDDGIPHAAAQYED